MRVAPRHHGAADEDDPHQAIACNLFGPRQAVVEHVAREKLQEHDERERPENGEHQPVFGVMFDHDLFVARDDEVDVFVRCFGCGAHVPHSLILRSAAKAVRLEGWPDPGHGSRHVACATLLIMRSSYFIACSASYSALLQPPLPSLCSGSAAARNASRSGTITVLPSFLNSSASFCSCSRICLVALSAACVSTSSNTFLSSSYSFR